MSDQKRTVDDYLQDGIYGAKEIRPEERRLYLGTIRERVEYVLRKAQVREQTVYPEIEAAMKADKSLHLYLNGNMSYEFLSKYVKLADQTGVIYTMVTNKEHDSELGAVLAHEDAVEKETVELPKRTAQKAAAEPKQGFFQRLFNRK